MHVFNWFPFPNDVSDYRVSLRHQKNHRDSEYEIFRQLCLSREHILQPSPTKTLLPLSGYPSSVLVVWWQQQSPPQPSVRVTVRRAPDGGTVPPGPPARPHHHQQRTVSPGVLVTVTLPPPPRHRPQPGRAQPSRQWTVLAAWRSPAPAQPSPASPGSCSQQLIRQM